MDITQLILDDHQEQRRLFSMLEQMEHADLDALNAVWARLATFLELHAKAEEVIFYPQLLQLGEGAGGKADAEEETEDAIKDHNEIRDAVSAVSKCAPGSDSWIEAIGLANKVNGDHMAEEEREGLTDFRRNAPVQLRHQLAVAFAKFEAVHSTGVASTNKDPEQYISDNS